MNTQIKKLTSWNQVSSQRSYDCLWLIRLSVGAVFLSEGVQKFLYPAMRGSGRFEKIGLPYPEVLGYLVGSAEAFCGALILVGFATRVVALPLILIMLGAIVVTKIPILLGHGFGPFGVRELSTYGVWSMAHEMRTDWAMLLGSIYLLAVGGGRWSLDAWVVRRSGEKDQ